MFKNLLSSLLGKDGEAAQVVLCAPVDGQFVALKDVADPVFSGEMLGKGVAVEPSSDTLVAPASGKVTQVFPTKHALTMQVKDAELLLHIGIDTVKLQGEGFTALVKTGDQVTKGTPLIKFDKAVLQEHKHPATVMMVICNHNEFKHFEVKDAAQVTAGDTEMVVLRK